MRAPLMSLQWSSIAAIALSLVATLPLPAADWMRFRGPNGSGIASAGRPPVTWSESDNLRWKTPLPGPGSSCPIVVGGQVFLTCYSGYGVDRDDTGEINQLRRHLVCVDLETGKLVWERRVDALLPEDPYGGFITEHGYASSTPVSDGETIFVFFGKSGVVAFDREGSQLWRTSVGTESGPQRWGSGASPILFGGFVIVNASEESQSLVALRKSDGSEAWRAEAEGMANVWGTPILAETASGPELVLAVAGEVWGLNPTNGKLRWFVTTNRSRNMCASLVASEDVVFAVGGRESGAAAVRIGGTGDATDSHLVWSRNARARITSPMVYEGNLYWFSRGIANCVSAETGESIFQERISKAGAGRGRGRGGQDYASPVLANGKFFLPTRSGTVHVMAAKPEFELLATNSFDSDDSDFNATPAVAGDALLIRSNRYLYCVASE